MNPVGVVTDSHSGISKKEADKLGISVLPMPFYIEGECYYEGVTITREEFFRDLSAGKKVSTSQPSPEAVMEIWREALKQYETILYLPISSGLSGSCGTAKMLAEEEEFKHKVYVVDHGRVASPLKRTILDTLELIREGYLAEQIRDILENERDKVSIYIAVETLEYLKKGGRITPATAAIGTLLNIKPVLQLDVGVLESFCKCRGMKKARKEMLSAIKLDMETRYREYYEKGELYLLAASSADEETTKGWIEEIKQNFPGMEVLSDNLSLAICCHTGEGALGVGCSCRPKRN
ncbi:MAG: DegV family protein [Lachnospiraceae bacterium]|nr:DegV family protein [Lachnospiraceae bacterium]